MQIINNQVKFQWMYDAFYWPFSQKVRPSIRFKTCGQVSQALVRWAFAALRENQKLDRELVKFGQVFKKLVRVIKKLGHVFVL